MYSHRHSPRPTDICYPTRDGVRADEVFMRRYNLNVVPGAFGPDPARVPSEAGTMSLIV